MAKKTKKLRIVPDTSVIISGILTDMIEKKKIRNMDIIIPEFVVEELRAQASKGREIGFKGLNEIKKLRELEKKKKLDIIKIGRRQTYEEIQLSKYGRIDALIMDVAKKEKAVLYTSDMVQSMTAEAEGVNTQYFKPYEKKETILSKMLTKETTSLHLKEGLAPLAKIGKPGKSKLVKIGKKKFTAKEIENIVKEIMDAVHYEEDSFIEIGGHKASVVQLADMRIAITRPPFSDGIEITLVRPIAKLSLNDYNLSDKLKERLEKKAEGILISGPPGSGKSTFAASVAEFFEENDKIVKTMESPRDLQVKPEITQYSKLKGSFENTADMLLLVRPDYTIFDEVRKTADFVTFSDMRLAGIGMVGVVHASDPISSVQRFVGRIDLGMIPHIVDTIIYIKYGKIEKVYTLTLTVRTPTGMTEADLARPLVEVKDFETGALEYEMYSYGEETVIIPVSSGKKSGIKTLAEKQILSYIRKFDSSARVNVIDENKAVVSVDNDAMPRLIGRKGSTIKELEERLGISIEVSPKVATLGKEVDFSKEETGAYIVFMVNAKPKTLVNFYIDDEFLFSATTGKSSQIRVAKDSDIGKDVMKALVRNELKLFV